MKLVDKILLESKGPSPQIDALLKIIKQSHKTQINPLSGRELMIDDLGQVEISWFDNMLHISSIESFNRGTGAGSKLLDILTSAADKLKYTCSLGAEPFGEGGLKKKDLIEFYLRHGFEIVPGQYDMNDPKKILKYVLSKIGHDESLEMIRKPK